MASQPQAQNSPQSQPQPQDQSPSPLGPAPHYLITRAEILQGRDVEFPLSSHLEENLSNLLVAVNKFRQIWGKPMHINSGYRPGHYNSDIGGAPNSTHLSCEAIDIADQDRSLTTFILANPSILVDSGLWMEHPKDTPSWVHVDIRPRNNRIFQK